jgi:hypothetical protein
MRRMAVVLAWARAPSGYIRGGAMRSFTCVLGLVFVMLVVSPPIGAQETTPASEAPTEFVDCLNPTFLSTALIDCAGLEAAASLEPADADTLESETDVSIAMASTAATASEADVLPPYCRVKADVVFWGARQWLELAEALRDDNSQCAEYYVSIPPRDFDLTQLRGRALFNEFRALHPRVHPVAEIRFTGSTGWRNWVVGPHPAWAPGRTFYGAGVEARRRMAQVRLDVTNGEIWALNELTEDVLEDVPGRRAEIREFLRGLYDGEPNMPKVRGIVFNVGVPSTASDVTAYKASVQEWLTDEPFWSDMDAYVDFFAHEVYASSLTWGVAGAPRATRAEYLNDYFHHLTILAEEGPETVEAARKFFRRTYLPLANAIWPSVTGDTLLLSAETMSQFISTQVYAVRHYANAHPQTAPQGRIGFGWAPLVGVAGYSEAGRNLIRSRLASAIHEAYEEGGHSQMGACGPPGEHIWCEGEVDGAFLNDAWKIFSSWD